MDLPTRYRRLRESYAPETNPHRMGTVSLVGWTIAHPGHHQAAFERIRTAVEIVRRRRGSVEWFRMVTLREIPAKGQRHRFARYFEVLTKNSEKIPE